MTREMLLWSALGVVLLTCLGGCSPPQTILGEFEKSTQRSLWVVRHTDPAREAERSIRARDFRFLGIASVGLWVPGVDAEDYDRWALKCGGVIIWGTSDVVTSKDEEQLNSLAPSYAYWYNKRLLRHLRK